MAIRLLAVGCDYRGESVELPDCSLDALNIASTLEKYLASGRELINEKATRINMLYELGRLKASMKPNDLAIVSFSGHGTSDIIDGKRVQGIVSNDLEIIYEWELRQALADLGQAVLISDSCFSGGLLRGRQKHRWIPASHCFQRQVKPPGKLPKKPHVRYLACKENETAASTGKGGALTLALLEAFAKRDIKSTFAGLGAELKKLLPSADCPQHPVYDCADRVFGNRSLNSFQRKWNVPPKGAA